MQLIIKYSKSLTCEMCFITSRASVSWPAVCQTIHTSPFYKASYNPEKNEEYAFFYQSEDKSDFPDYNKIVYPPQDPSEPPRPIVSYYICLLFRSKVFKNYCIQLTSLLQI